MTGEERRGGRAATPASPLPRANGNNGLGLFQRFILNSPLLLNATEFGSASRPLKGLGPDLQRGTKLYSQAIFAALMATSADMFLV